ncbi:hypothetical protein BH11MYX2_BH11MYX2_09960 [soil metagenome]
MGYVISQDTVERTITTFTKLDQRGDKKAMNKLALRLQKEQPNLLQFAAAVRTEHGDAVGEAAVFYATLVWAMFDKSQDGTLPRVTGQNLADADKVVTAALAAVPGIDAKPVHERVAPNLAETQPNIYKKLVELLAEDIKEAAMTEQTGTTIIKPTQVVIEAFDAAMTGRRVGDKQGTVVAEDKPGRNDPCNCGSGKKYKKCHGASA